MNAKPTLETPSVLNPQSDRFDFNLWSQAVRQRLLRAFQKKDSISK
jgi:hypothetical protein